MLTGCATGFGSYFHPRYHPPPPTSGMGSRIWHMYSPHHLPLTQLVTQKRRLLRLRLCFTFTVLGSVFSDFIFKPIGHFPLDQRILHNTKPLLRNVHSTHVVLRLWKTLFPEINKKNLLTLLFEAKKFSSSFTHFERFVKLLQIIDNNNLLYQYISTIVVFFYKVSKLNGRNS